MSAYEPDYCPCCGIEVRECPECFGIFPVRRVEQVYCSRRCKEAARDKRRGRR